MDPDDIQDLFQSVGPVSIRRMFGGKGIYVDGTIIAVELRGELMLKGDTEAGALYEEAGSKRWGYTHNKSGKEVARIQVEEPIYIRPAERVNWL